MIAERIDPDERLRAEEGGVDATTVAGRKINFRFGEGGSVVVMSSCMYILYRVASLAFFMPSP